MIHDPIETIDFKYGVKLHICMDEDPCNPRDEDNLAHLICFHPRYRLGDRHTYARPADFLAHLAYEVNPPLDEVDDDYALLDIDSLLDLIEERAVIQPVALFDHSGLRMYLGSGAHGCDPGGWDSGQVGWCYITHEEILKEWPNLKEHPVGLSKRGKEIIEAEVAHFDQYLSGDVYGYIVESPLDSHAESCWGFFGSQDDAREDGERAARCVEQQFGPGDYVVNVVRTESRGVDIIVVGAESRDDAINKALDEAANMEFSRGETSYSAEAATRQDR